MTLPAGLRARLVSVAERLAICEQDRQGLIDERDVLVVRALLRGASEREIARHAGITGVRVHQIKERDVTIPERRKP